MRASHTWETKREAALLENFALLSSAEGSAAEEKIIFPETEEAKKCRQDNLKGSQGRPPYHLLARATY